jgi:hypothetical protein
MTAADFCSVGAANTVNGRVISYAMRVRVPKRHSPPLLRFALIKNPNSRKSHERPLLWIVA